MKTSELMATISKIVKFLVKVFFQRRPDLPTSPVPDPTPLPSRPAQVEPFVYPTQDSQQPDFPRDTELPIITTKQLQQIIPSLSEIRCREYLPYLLQTMKEFEIDTPLRIAAFIAQTTHESAGYSAFSENLNYSAQALINTWPNRFTAETAATYARQPEKIANYVYGNRRDLGNRGEESGDGWRYRGRGVIQITGRANYEVCGVGLKLDLVTSPELLEQPLNAFRSAGYYWRSRNCNSFADKEDFIGLTRVINGSLNGLEDRKAYYARAKSVLGIT